MLQNGDALALLTLRARRTLSALQPVLKAAVGARTRRPRSEDDLIAAFQMLRRMLSAMIRPSEGDMSPWFVQFVHCHCPVVPLGRWCHRNSSGLPIAVPAMVASS